MFYIIVTCIPFCVLRKENGVGGLSPNCFSKNVYLIVLPSIRGGVPELMSMYIYMYVQCILYKSSIRTCMYIYICGKNLAHTTSSFFPKSEKVKTTSNSHE